DLSAYVRGGDSIRLRFAVGTDGCSGYDGWYIDDVRLITCDLARAKKSDGCGGCGATGMSGSVVGLLGLLLLQTRRRRRHT
ncbi:MAG: MYXO-CTERM sorting domain-containing protein, partial [Myxococcota bacterium]